MFKIRKIKKIKRIKKKTTNNNFEPKVSKIEIAFGIWLKTFGIDWKDQFKISTKFYDFKVKNIPLIIEFHGDY